MGAGLPAMAPVATPKTRQTIPQFQHPDKLNAATVFKDTQCYALLPTNPCATAYGYARIRRLVRPGGRR